MEGMVQVEQLIYSCQCDCSCVILCTFDDVFLFSDRVLFTLLPWLCHVITSFLVRCLCVMTVHYSFMTVCIYTIPLWYGIIAHSIYLLSHCYNDTTSP